MNKTIYTFWELLKDCPVVIPQVQRDYAYGREDDKAIAVCNNILNSIHEVLVPDNLDEAGMVPLTLDFVYGNIRKNVGLNPLDGQQRLTTLFLIHLFATIKEGLTDEKKELKKFFYETRQSANNFCHSLIDDFILDVKSSKKLSKQILDHPKCLPVYKSDPTISSMIVVLDRVAEKFNDIDNLWKKLTEERRVIFYFQPLSDFGLSDDLYIKMNSRGKSLTNYELFKSDFLEFLEDSYPNYKKLFAEKLDGIWTDILWKHAETGQNGTRSVRSVDDGFLNLFYNISVLLYHLRTSDNFSDNGGKDSKHLTSPFSEQFTCTADIDTLYKIFILIEKALTDDSMSPYIKNLFYHTDNVAGDGSEKIRIFWKEKETLFVLAFRDRLTRQQMILFYALYLGIENGLEFNELKIRLRHLRNLVANSPFQLRGNLLHGMLIDTQSYMTSGVFPSTEYFNTIQVKEELIKIEMPDWNTLWSFEDHSILRGSLGLFIKNGATDQLPKFMALFNENYKENTEILRRAMLIAGEGAVDYWQYQAYMQPSDKQWKRWMLVCDSSNWPDFFTENHQRHNQEAIINCLRALPNSLDELVPYVDEGIKNLSKKSWKYYMVKYPGDWNTVRCGTYGIYHWDDIENKPIEVIMLNSQSHSANNLEWNILNLTLRWAFEDKCSIDYHGSAPVKLNYANSLLDAKQEGWAVSTYEGEYLLEELRKSYVTAFGMTRNDDGTISMTIPVEDDKDYIEYGMKLIKDIEQIYSSHHSEKEASDDILGPDGSSSNDSANISE